MKKYFLNIFILLFLIINFFAVDFSIAANPTDYNKIAPVTLSNPLGNKMTDPNILIGQIINTILGIVGSLALIMFVYGGFTWMTAAGAPEKVNKGKDIIVWAIIGLIVIFMAYAGVNEVIKGVTGK